MTAAGPEPCARLGRFDSGTVSDALDSLGMPAGVPGLRPLWPSARICGPARTVRLVPAGGAAGAPAGPKRHLGAAAIDAARPGDVIVVDNAGRLQPGAWGGLLSIAATTRGVAGVVVDGACRDVEEAEQLAFPVFARGATPRTARGRVVEESSGAEVEIGGVTVREGDLVLADATGVVFVPASSLERVLAEAERIGRREAEMSRRLRAGESASSVMGASYEDMLAGGTG